MQPERIKELADTCAAWLDGHWRDIPSISEQSEEEAILYAALSQLRERLIAVADNDEKWNRKLKKLQDRLLVTEVLFEAAKVLSSTLELEPLLTTIIDKISEMSELTDGAAMFLYDEDREELEMVASFGYPSYHQDRSFLKPGEGAPGAVFRLRHPILVIGEEQVAALYNSIQSETKVFTDLFARSHPLPSQSVICVPFIARGKVIGSLQLEHWTDRRTFTNDDLKLYMHLADLIAISVDNGMLWRELCEKEDRHQQMVGQLINAQETERKRIARELHDDASQALTTVAIGLSSLSGIVPVDNPEIQSKIISLRDEVKSIMGRMRDLTFAIRPSILDDLGLVPALKWYISRFTGLNSPEIVFSYDDNGKKLNPLLATVLFRVAQEAINNALRYSQATEIKMALHMTGEIVALTIEDNGVGFDVDRMMKNTAKSLGLYGMSERVALFDGSLNIRSIPGEGTTIHARIPLDGEKN
ncbi:MAG: GAF domain-containing sensor histidine kinase [Anaerolineales bacterium]|nr:GAF domain-containing sensor histidine kinase [Anaerolineales bacterium]